jgi:endonuclease/exonuclease/phosphatase family metal-dependent hydrolase
MHTLGARRGIGVLVAAALLALALVPATASAGPRPAKVMSLNLYLGADLTPAITAGSPAALAAAGGDIWETVQRTNFPARAKILARDIVNGDPDLIGLQEAAKWYTGIPDGPPIPPFNGSPAGTQVYDFQASLLAELAALGQPYVEVVSQNEANIEGPTDLGFDIRLQQRDVILAKKSKVDAGEITWSNTQAANYPAQIQLNLPLLGGVASVQSTRGYVSADVVVNKRAFRFVNTHLEAFQPYLRAAQAGFLVQAGPASTTTQKVVLVGDLNSDPGDDPPAIPPPAVQPLPSAYTLVTAVAGYTDTWPVANPGNPGFTSGFNEFVNDADTSGLDSRIDHVMTRGGVGVTSSTRTGVDSDNRIQSGADLLWPSDHAGVVATLTP